VTDQDDTEERWEWPDTALVAVALVLCAVAAGVAKFAPRSCMDWISLSFLGVAVCIAILYWRTQKRKGYF
jgi:protein-S-isoprenylcysteine O-methyltransferase Ste14